MWKKDSSPRGNFHPQAAVYWPVRVHVHPGVDYYELIGVRRDAAPEDIRRAYRRKAWELHPDRQAPELRAEAEHWTKILNVAFETLRNPRLRELYDIKREARPWPAPNPAQRSHPTSSVWTATWLDDDLDYTPPTPVLHWISDRTLLATLYTTSAILLTLRALL